MTSKYLLLLTMAALLTLLGISEAAPTNRGLCYSFPDMLANGHLMDIPSKGRLYKTSDGAWRKYQSHAKIIEWEFYPSPFRIVNYGVTTGRANVLQVTVKESNDQEPTSYWFEIGRGDQCKFAKDPKVAAAFAKIDRNSVVGVWHYNLAHWP